MTKFPGFHVHTPHLHHHHPHPRQHAGAFGSCGSWRRRNYVLVLLVLVTVLVANMVLLLPRLHAHDSSSGSSGNGWHSHLVGFTASGWSSSGSAAAAAAAGAEAGPAAAAAAGKTIKASSSQQQAQQVMQQQQPAKPRGSSSVAAGDFVGVYDANKDGVLGPTEWHMLVREACRADRASLPLLQRIRRLVRLGLGLNPRSTRASSRSSSRSADPYPCTLTSELADATQQAAAAITGRGGGQGRQAGSSGSKAAGRSGGGVDSIRAATGAAGAATVDPDSPEGRAAAQSAALLAGCSRLSPELAQAAASEGSLLLTAADWSLFELFGVNWLAAVQRAGLDNYLIVALDQRTADFLRNNKLGHCVMWSSAAGLGSLGDGPLPRQSEAYQAGSRAHRTAAWANIQAASVLMSWGFNVLLSDLDVVWLTDPMPYLRTHVPAAADLVLATDSPANRSIMESSDPGLLRDPSPQLAVNPAVAFLRASPAGQAAVAAWLSAYQSCLESEEQGRRSSSRSNEQPGFPDAVVRSWLQQPAAAKRHPSEPQRLLLLSNSAAAGGGLFGLLFGGSSRNAAIGLFSPIAVANSYSWAVQGVGSRAAAVRGRSGSGAATPGRKLPLAVHMSRGGSSREGRLHRMREAQWYADGPRYYSEPKLLSFDLQPFSSPAATALATAPDAPQQQLLQLHLEALQQQLQQLYAAAAVAVALGRVLVLPPLQCYCYRDPDSGPQGPPTWMVEGWAAAGVGSAAADGSSSSSSSWSCRAPGDDVSVLPFNCTLDQVFSPQLMYRHLPVFNGRPLNFREHSFLTNARTPSWVRHAATRISSGTPAGCDGDDSSGINKINGKCAQVLPGKPPEVANQQVIVPVGLTDVELVTVLQPFAVAKYLHFTDITQVFGSFANPNHRIEYERWLDRVVLPWCCKPAAAATGDGSSSSSSIPAADAAVEAAADGLPPSGWVTVDVKARQQGSSNAE